MADPCMDFPGAKTVSGYGVLRHLGKTVYAHRLAFAEANGFTLAEIRGVVIRHTCDNPACRNPSHLITGTQFDNIRDMVERDRHARGERNKHAVLAVADVLAIREAPGTHATLAAKFGVSRATIGDIKSGRSWKHV